MAGAGAPRGRGTGAGAVRAGPRMSALRPYTVRKGDTLFSIAKKRSAFPVAPPGGGGRGRGPRGRAGAGLPPSLPPSLLLLSPTPQPPGADGWGG